MKARTLLLMRHAKSSWDDPDLDDHDRPLNKRGRRASKAVGNLIQQRAFQIDLILCSSSVRTCETLDRVFKEFSRRPKVEYLPQLYAASAEAILHLLSDVDPTPRCVLVIAHNPGLEDLLAQLTGERHRFPTAALAAIELDVDRWDQLDGQTRGRMNQLWIARELESD